MQIGGSKVKWDADAEKELWADVCRKSFWHFCDFALGFGDHPDYRWWTPRVHRPFCDWFELHIREWLDLRARGETRQIHLMVVVHREFGKTMVITKAGTLWLHVQNPNLSSYIGSSTVTRAQDFFAPIKTIISGADPHTRFTWLYGNWYNKDRTWAAASVVHGARTALSRSEPSIGTWGVETGLTGTHPDHGVMDDPIDYEQMGKDGQWLEKVNTHLVSLAPVFKADSLFIYTGTRYHDADAIGESFRLEGVQSVDSMPIPGVNISPEGKWRVYFRAAREDDGTPSFPENWPEKRLKDYEKRHSIQYAAQLMNNPHSGVHAAITREQIDNLMVKPDDVPRNLRISLHMDTAFKDRANMNRGDESVILWWGHTVDGTGDVYFLGGIGANSWRVEQFADQLIILLQKLKKQRQYPFCMTDEAEIGGKTGTWAMTIQSWCHTANMVCPRIELLQRGGTKKVQRILGAVAYWQNGNVRLVEGALGLDRLADQMLRIGTSAHDDWADCGADVFHPKVYTPPRRGTQLDAQPKIARPWDRELQPGTMTDDWARSRYDETMEDAVAGRPPID
jgi:hypothetical protein